MVTRLLWAERRMPNRCHLTRKSRKLADFIRLRPPLYPPEKPELSGTKRPALAPLFAFPLDRPALFCKSMPDEAHVGEQLWSPAVLQWSSTAPN